MTALLAPLALAYRGAVAARAGLYARGWLRSETAEVPVISIGNLVAGGTGKTPFTAMVAGILRDAGLRPAIVSRGYGGRRREDPLVVAGADGPRAGVTAALAGDEPVMLGRLVEGVPVVVARRRAEGARLAVATLGARCLVLDDGFQHLALRRDLDIVLLDAAAPLAEGRLLPAGILREPPSALRRADILVLAGSRLWDAHDIAATGGVAPVTSADPDTIRALARPGAGLLHASFEPTLLVSARDAEVPGRSGPESLTASWLAGMRVVAFAGIARPQRLVLDLRRLGAEVVSFFAFPDHHRFRTADLEPVLDAARRLESEILLTTEKDLARLRGTPLLAPLVEAGLVALRLEASVAPAEREGFERLLVETASGRRARGKEAAR